MLPLIPGLLTSVPEFSYLSVLVEEGYCSCKDRVEGQAPSAVPVLSQNSFLHLFLSSHWSEMCSHQDVERLGKLLSFLKITKLEGVLKITKLEGVGDWE